MLKKFEEFITKNGLCSKEQRVLLAVSGGLDSMALLHLFVRCGYTIGVAHANFQLRERESDEDEDFVRSMCARHAILFYSERFETKNYATRQGLSIQMAARELRYSWFYCLAVTHGFDCIATAHHLNDSAETILLNLTRGWGGEALQGIPVRNQNVIRPLLFATREEIERYAADQGITWREDESNAEADYLRNKIRNLVIPVLKEINPSLEEAVERTTELAKGEDELIARAILLWKEKYYKVSGNQVSIEKDGLKEWRHPSAILRRLIAPFGFNFDQGKEIIEVMDGQPGKQFLSPTHQLVIDRKDIIISKHQDSWNEVEIESGQSQYKLGPLMLSFKSEDGFEINPDPLMAFLDVDKIRFPLKWRLWRDGDSFHPLGMDHRKKVSDFFINKKVSLADKQIATVLESDSEIIWLVGHRIDNRFKVTSATKRVLRIQLLRG